jgi:hypothetical protein
MEEDGSKKDSFSLSHCKKVADWLSFIGFCVLTTMGFWEWFQKKRSLKKDFNFISCLSVD